MTSLRAARFYRYLDVEPDERDAVLIGLESGAPALLERSLGLQRLQVPD